MIWISSSVDFYKRTLFPAICLACLCDLSRIQWVSPLFARLLLEAGYGSVARVSAAQSSELVQAIADANARLLLFKGKIGQKDMARLVYCANLLSQELEF